MKDKITTLLLVIKENEILLAQKKRGFGVGKYNGVGGKVEAGETVEQAMIRETKEEIDIIPTKYTKRAVITFSNLLNGERFNIIMHVYVATEYEGEIKESEEMRPQWYKINNIPYKQMFPDDKIWLPVLLSGQNFEGYFKFDENFEVLEHRIEIKDSI